MTGTAPRASPITENWIQSGLLKAGMVVCANNDEMALGAINALKAGNLLDTVFVGGVDATSEALAAMQAGDLEVTVFQDAEGQGRAASTRPSSSSTARPSRQQPRRHPLRSSRRRTCRLPSAPTGHERRTRPAGQRVTTVDSEARAAGPPNSRIGPVHPVVPTTAPAVVRSSVRQAMGEDVPPPDGRASPSRSRASRRSTTSTSTSRPGPSTP